MLLLLTLRTSAGSVYWFAGFRLAGGVAVGIDFEADPLNAGLACLGAVLMTAAMIFAWRYFPQVGTYFHVLMLTFLAGMTGFCLTGDVFDLFVWFELMGVSAYALTAYRPEERGPIQGAQLRDHQQRGRLPVADRHRGSSGGACVLAKVMLPQPTPVWVAFWYVTLKCRCGYGRPSGWGCSGTGRADLGWRGAERGRCGRAQVG
jgi:hypothetical protein